MGGARGSGARLGAPAPRDARAGGGAPAAAAPGGRPSPPRPTPPRPPHGDLTREELHGMLLGAFAGALIASGASGGLPTEILPA